MLVQTKRLSREAFDAIAGDRRAEGSRRDAQSQSRKSFMIGEHRQTEIGIGESFAATLHVAKFGRLVQSLARLEGQPLDKIGDR